MCCPEPRGAVGARCSAIKLLHGLVVLPRNASNRALFWIWSDDPALEEAFAVICEYTDFAVLEVEALRTAVFLTNGRGPAGRSGGTVVHVLDVLAARRRPWWRLRAIFWR